MEIVMVKDPFDYRMFYHLLKYSENEIDGQDAKILGRRVCSKLQEKTNVRWVVKTCVGGKCTIGTIIIPNRNLRKKKEIFSLYYELSLNYYLFTPLLVFFAWWFFRSLLSIYKPLIYNDEVWQWILLYSPLH